MLEILLLAVGLVLAISLWILLRGEQNMKDSRIKEIEHLIYIKSVLIQETKKEIKELQLEKAEIYGEKKLERDRQRIRNKQLKPSCEYIHTNIF